MLTLNDGRSELWQWDTGRTLAVDADCSQVHFSNKVFGRSIDVDVAGGVAIIPDILLQTDKDLNVWAFVGTAENGYTKISKTFKVNRRNKPADYVFTPIDQITLQAIQHQIGDLSDLTTEAKDTLVAAINEAARTGGGSGSMELRVADGYVQYSRDGGSTWENLIAMADLKGDPGAPGKDGHSPVVTATKSGKTTTISVDGEDIATVEDGADGAPGSRGSDGITPTIGQNGNWFLGEEDTGKPSRGEDGATGATGATGEKGTDGKSAYAYAVEGGYTGTETEFSAKLAAEKFANPNALTFTGAVTGSYDGSAPLSVEIPSGGGSGSDISLGLTGAAVGQIAKITAVDDTGKPTAWSPVDMPSGGGDETNFQLVFNQECVLDAGVSEYVVNIGFGLQDFKELIALVKYSGSTNDVYQDQITFDGVTIEAYGGATFKNSDLMRVIYAKRVTQTEYMGIHRASGNPFDWSSGNMPSTLSYFSNRISTPTGKLKIWRNKSTEAATITIKLYKR